MKLILILLFSFTSFAANAANFVVKFKSAPCDRPALAKVGSGILISTEAKETWLLTSDHTVYHGNASSGICHTVISNGRNLDAEFKSADIFYGLAVLRVHDSADGLSAAWKLRRVPRSRNEFVKLVGFPFRSDSVLVDDRAQVLDWNGSRPIFPLQQTLIEIKGHVEYGMSGGALTGANDELLGLVSHKYLRMNDGSPSSTEQYNQNPIKGEYVALAVPISDALDWMINAIKGKAGIQLDTALAMGHRESVVLSGIRFTTKPCEGGSSRVGGEGVGVGGEGMGVGGEGVGVGGTDEFKPACQIVAKLEPNTKSSDFPFPENRWFKSLRERMIAGSTAQIDGLYFDGRQLPLLDLQHFFTAVRKGYMPITKIQNPYIKNPEVEAEIRGIGKEIKLYAETLASQVPTNAPDLNDFLNRIAALGGALQNSQEYFTSSDELYKTAESKVWNRILMVDFKTTVAIRSRLFRASEVLSTVQP